MVLDARSALEIQDELAGRWHGAADGRIRFAYSVRTIFNATDEFIEGGPTRARGDSGRSSRCTSQRSRPKMSTSSRPAVARPSATWRPSVYWAGASWPRTRFGSTPPRWSCWPGPELPYAQPRL